MLLLLLPSARLLLRLLRLLLLLLLLLSTPAAVLLLLLLLVFSRLLVVLLLLLELQLKHLDRHPRHQSHHQYHHHPHPHVIISIIIITHDHHCRCGLLRPICPEQVEFFRQNGTTLETARAVELEISPGKESLFDEAAARQVYAGFSLSLGLEQDYVRV